MSNLIFAHQLEALRKRQRIRDEEVLGKVPRRRRLSSDADQLNPPDSGRQPAIDWWAPSCLVEWSRWTDGVRIPFVGLTSISKCEVPRAADGRTHPRYPDQAAQTVGHFGYIERQDRAARSTLLHIDYIEREEVRDRDEDEAYFGHVLTNIHRNPAVRRAFAKAVWEAERNPRPPHLLAWSTDAPWWAEQAARVGAPEWVLKAADLVGTAAREAEAKALTKGRTAKPFQVDLGEVSAEEAYDRLVWIDHKVGASDILPKLEFSSKYGGRVQYRIVYELPDGLRGKERFEIARGIARWCKRNRFMYVIAIHRPDSHNDRRNFHLHIDIYDRPCRWLKRFGMWDFQVAVKARNGDIRYPYRQNKTAEFSRDTTGRCNHRDYGKELMENVRKTFVNITNEVLERTPLVLRYHAGPAAALGLNLTPTKKLGGRKMAAERHGVRTPEGDHNAQAIWTDRFASIDRTLDEARRQDEARVAKVRAALNASGRSHNDNALQLSTELDKWAAELADVRELRHHIDRTDAEFARARSRAEAVLREAAKADEREQTERAYRTSVFASRRGDLVAEAKEHLKLVQSMAPEQGRVEAERVTVAQRSEAAAAWGESIERAAEALQSEPKQHHIRLSIAELSTPAQGAELSSYERLEIENRVGSYLRSNPNRISRHDGYILIEAPQAVLTLLAKHRCKAGLRQLLLAAAAPTQVMPERAAPPLSPSEVVPPVGDPIETTVPEAPPMTPPPPTKAEQEMKGPPCSDAPAREIEERVTAVTTREPTSDDRLRFEVLLEEAREQRRRVDCWADGYRVLPLYDGYPSGAWKALEHITSGEEAQVRLLAIHAEQNDEIARLIKSIETLDAIAVDQDGSIKPGAIPGMEELIKAWGRRFDVSEAVKERQAAIGRAQQSTPSPFVNEQRSPARPNAGAPMSETTSPAPVPRVTAQHSFDKTAPGLDERIAALVGNELTSTEAARLHGLLEEIQEKRYPVYRWPDGYEASDAWFKERSEDRELLARTTGSEEVQARLLSIHTAQSREIDTIIKRVETLESVPVDQDGRLKADAICGLEELVKVWRFRVEVTEAVKKRQAAIKREREAELRAEKSPLAKPVKEDFQKEAQIDTAECKPATTPPSKGEAEAAAIVSIPSTTPTEHSAKAEPEICEPTPPIGAAPIPSSEPAPQPEKRSTTEPRQTVPTVSAPSESERKLLEKTILAGRHQRGTPSTSATEIARRMVRIRSEKTADGPQPTKQNPPAVAQSSAASKARSEPSHRAIHPDSAASREATGPAALDQRHRLEAGASTEKSREPRPNPETVEVRRTPHSSPTNDRAAQEAADPPVTEPRTKEEAEIEDSEVLALQMAYLAGKGGMLR